MLLPWSDIETVFLDMDGTLLDLYFDNYFWLEYLPLHYGKTHGLTLPQSQKLLNEQFAKRKGQLEWYCVDYWSDVLNVSIMDLKRSIAHLIGWRDHAEFFLDAINQMGKQVVLITNAHPKSLQLKMQKTNLSPWFHAIISSHEYGFPKETQQFWLQLKSHITFDADTSLFIDDSISVLRSAKEYGIKYLLTIDKPDSKQPSSNQVKEFVAIKDFRYLIDK